MMLAHVTLTLALAYLQKVFLAENTPTNKSNNFRFHPTCTKYQLNSETLGPVMFL